MKKRFSAFLAGLAIVLFCSGCFTYSYDVGRGAQTGITTKESNIYLIQGLAPVKVSDPAEMAKGASDYSVKIEHTFIDGLLAAITFGIYTPTTTTVTR